MNSKQLALGFFILVALAQLYAPAKMILDREDILASGTEYKFKVAPIDPNDPFRGKYITLSFDNNTVSIENEEDWAYDEEVYVVIETDDDGFAKIKSASKQPPNSELPFLKAEVNFISYNNQNKLSVAFPFDRFYMEESKAPIAEEVYRESQIDPDQITYALVSIKDGNAVLKDVMINGVSIKETAERGSQKDN